jgi:signal peptidase II
VSALQDSGTLTTVAPVLAQRRFEWLLIALVVVADQVTKLLVVLELGLHDSVPVFPGMLDLTHVRNTGAAFGFLNAVDFPGKPIVIAIVALGALVGVSLYASQLPAAHWLARLGLSLILGGAAGNLIDRLRQGYVVDFVDAYWGSWHFWAFNVADAAISVGVTIIIVDLLRPAHASPPPDLATHESESPSVP